MLNMGRSTVQQTGLESIEGPRSEGGAGLKSDRGGPHPYSYQGGQCMYQWMQMRANDIGVREPDEPRHCYIYWPAVLQSEIISRRRLDVEKRY